MAAALATLHPLPPSELAALVLVVSEATKIATADSNDCLGVNPGGGTEQPGCWWNPACQTGKLPNPCITLWCIQQWMSFP